MTKLKPDPIDLYVGRRLELARRMAGLSQMALGQELGLSFQQIQKYEKGTNRIAASRLFRLSSRLGVPVSFFFEDLPDEIGGRQVKRNGGLHGSGALRELYSEEQGLQRAALRLVSTYLRIPDQKLRDAVLGLVSAIAPAGAAMPAPPPNGEDRQQAQL
ncbi:MAG: helix-turn-helix domain-containing protein [Kiloniellales bacterium]|nr:helix-turn-helix domain-containing protein [Kiloniellales bacterium]